MAYIVSDITKRYGVSVADLYEKLRQQEDLSQDDVKPEMVITEKAVRILDVAYGFTEAEPELSDDAKRAAELEKKNEILTRQIDELKSAVQAEKSVATDYQKELDELQQKFHSIQEGHEGMNSTLIKKYKGSAERYQKQYTDLSAQYTTTVQQNNERFLEYEARIKEYEERLQGMNELQKREFMNETKLLEASKKESKLQSQISQKNSEINNLVLAKNQADELKSQSIQQAEFIKSYLYETADKLEAVVSNIRTRMDAEHLPVVDLVATVTEDPTIMQRPVPKSFSKVADEPQKSIADVLSDNEAEDDMSKEQPGGEAIIQEDTAKEAGDIFFDDLDFQNEKRGGAISNLKKRFSGLFSML